MKTELLQDLLKARSEKRPVVRAAHLESGQERLLEAPFGDDALGRAAEDALRTDRSLVPEAAPEWFLRPYNPPLRLVVVGAVHVAQSLIPMAELAGYHSIVVDPREAFAREERFAGVPRWTDWPDEAMEKIGPDARTAVVTLTHDPKLDDPALQAALRSPAFYIGALGSKRTHASRMQRLTKAGFDEASLARIHGPVGLSIGARTPAEIAVSILAQITDVLRRAPQ